MFKHDEASKEAVCIEYTGTAEINNFEKVTLLANERDVALSVLHFKRI